MPQSTRSWLVASSSTAGSAGALPPSRSCFWHLLRAHPRLLSSILYAPFAFESWVRIPALVPVHIGSLPSPGVRLATSVTTLPMSAAAAFKSGLKGVMFGGILYLVGDQASDMITYSKMHNQAMELVAQDKQIPQMIGEPYTSGAWYDATLAFSHRDKVAHCTFQLKGSRGVTDIAVKAGRQPGYKSNILYNTIGPATWQLVTCQVMVPSEGGLVAPRSLMPEHQQQQQQQQAGQTAGVCDPCQLQQGQQLQQKPTAQDGGDPQPQQQQQQEQERPAESQRRWGRKLWWRRRQQQEQQQQEADKHS